MTLVYPVDELSRIAEVRRASIALANDEGLDKALSGNAAVVVTEICTNLVKFGKQAEVFLSPLSHTGTPGLEILAIDRGPGMADVAQCLADGYSSATTPGTGLGAIARLSTEFDIYSQQPQGSVLVARIRQPLFSKTLVGAAVKPVEGEQECGDAWAFRKTKDEAAFIVADGLGHGPMAAKASTQAVAAFRRCRNLAPTAVLGAVHDALQGTRGAAVAVACVNRKSSTVKYAGTGNISGVLTEAGHVVQMVSHNGTAGYGAPRFQEFSYPFAEETLLVMHSDGLHTTWNLDDYPALRRRDPSVLAGIVYRDAARMRDDACVVVAFIGSSS